MKEIRVIALFAVALAMSIPAVAAGTDTLLAEGIRCHDEARVDPEKNIARGKEILGALEKDTPLARAYYGSIITIEAGIESERNNLVKAITLLNEGSAYLDSAVAASPNEKAIRFVRMVNAYEISVASPLNRFKEMKADIDWFEANRAKLDPDGLGTFELYKGLYLVKAHRVDEAVDAFDACVAASPDSPEAKEARIQIARYAE